MSKHNTNYVDFPFLFFFPSFIFRVYYTSKQILFIFFNNQHNVAISRCSKYSLLSIGCFYVIIITTYYKETEKEETYEVVEEDDSLAAG
jgi:hypothetical protein